MKIGCLFLNLKSNFFDREFENYSTDNFFAINAVNSFKKWNPEVEVHYIDDNNLLEYLEKLNMDNYYDHVGLLKIHFSKELMKYYKYDKLISLGIDTLTCSRLDEFLDNNEDDMICTLGANHTVETIHYTTPTAIFKEGDITITDTISINGDVVCFNNQKVLDTLYDVSIQYWTDHAEQGGMNYCYLHQKELDIKVSIVEFPYHKSKVVYNVRSKGVIGGYCLVRGKVLNGRKGQVIDDVYPSLEFYIDKDKLYTKDHKQIKVFHFCEGLGYRMDTDELSYEEQVYEIKHMWFNEETKEFLKSKCNCIFE
jgi:hypothetical protein